LVYLKLQGGGNYRPFPQSGSACSTKRPRNRKYERPVAWGRPAFLISPPGCGVIEALGVWEGASIERLGRPPAGCLPLSERTVPRLSQRVTCNIAYLLWNASSKGQRFLDLLEPDRQKRECRNNANTPPIDQKPHTFQSLTFAFPGTLQQAACDSLQLNGAPGVVVDFRKNRPQVFEKAPWVFTHGEVTQPRHDRALRAWYQGRDLLGLGRRA